jgi:hypothetical protein
MSKDEMKKHIMGLMTIRQIKALKTDDIDFIQWLDAVVSLAMSMEKSK